MKVVCKRRAFMMRTFPRSQRGFHPQSPCDVHGVLNATHRRSAARPGPGRGVRSKGNLCVARALRTLSSWRTRPAAERASPGLKTAQTPRLEPERQPRERRGQRRKWPRSLDTPQNTWKLWQRVETRGSAWKRAWKRVAGVGKRWKRRNLKIRKNEFSLILRI